MNERDPEFEEWTHNLPPKHWAKRDISAARQGWDAAKARYGSSADSVNRLYDAELRHSEEMRKQLKAALDRLGAVQAVIDQVNIGAGLVPAIKAALSAVEDQSLVERQLSALGYCPGCGVTNNEPHHSDCGRADEAGEPESCRCGDECLRGSIAAGVKCKMFGLVQPFEVPFALRGDDQSAGGG